MPLVKELQQKYGKDKLAVLILNVDLSYDYSEEAAIKGAKKHMKQQGVDFPMALMANGFDDTQRMFHLDGYGIALVGPDGKVISTHESGRGLQDQLAKAI
jgi:hypothetical protein